jgi:hypothetical protein
MICESQNHYQEFCPIVWPNFDKLRVSMKENQKIFQTRNVDFKRSELRSHHALEIQIFQEEIV